MTRLNIEFSNSKDLYERVLPALKTKVHLKDTKYPDIKEIDIWNYLVYNKWIKSHNLVLYEVVDDILNVDLKLVDAYLKEKV